MNFPLEHPTLDALRRRLVVALQEREDLVADNLAHAISVEHDRRGEAVCKEEILAKARERVGLRPFLDKLRVLHLPADWAERAPVPRECVVQGLAPRGKVSALVSGGGAGKTTVLSEQTGSVTLAMQWHGLTVIGGDVAIISWEDELPDYAGKLFGAARANPVMRERAAEIRDRVHFVPMQSTGMHLVESIESRAAISSLADALAVRLSDFPRLVWVIVETASRANAADEMNEGMARLVEACERVAQRLNVAVTISHHVTKASLLNGNGTLDATAARGGTALVDNARATTVIVRIDRDTPTALLPPGMAAADIGDRDVILVDNVRSSYSRRAPRIWLERRYTPEGLPFLWPLERQTSGDATSALAAADGAFLEFLLRRMAGEWHSERAITRDWIEEHGLAERKARGALSRLVSAGEIQRADRRQYGDHGRMVTMYRSKVST